MDNAVTDCCSRSDCGDVQGLPHADDGDDDFVMTRIVGRFSTRDVVDMIIIIIIMKTMFPIVIIIVTVTTTVVRLQELDERMERRNST